MNLIVTEDEKRRMNYVKLIGKGETGYRGDFKKSSFPEKAGLEDWCRGYCEDSAGIKQFVSLPYIASFPFPSERERERERSMKFEC